MQVNKLYGIRENRTYGEETEMLLSFLCMNFIRKIGRCSWNLLLIRSKDIISAISITPLYSASVFSKSS